MVQRRPRPDPATLVGKGKVEEIAAVAASAQATLILFDHDLTPTQLRNLERALPVRVVDRTQLILDIFARHARSREGQLQVELAQLEYMLPRLAGRGAAMSQLGGGIGTRGPGETQLETDRRKIQRRLLQLKRELEDVRRVRTQQRHRRASVPVPTIALVGYTNAGKSTLFNRLTDAGVLASSRMFSTLDPKLRALVLPSRRKSTLIGHGRLYQQPAAHPHHFLPGHAGRGGKGRSASPRAGLLQPAARTTERGSGKGACRTGCAGQANRPGSEQSGSIAARGAIGVLCDDRSTAVHLGAQPVRASLICWSLSIGLSLPDPIVEDKFMVPQREGAVLAALDAGALILKREFSGDFVDLEVAGPASLLARYRQYQVQPKTGV